jgi:hypothetical protein
MQFTIWHGLAVAVAIVVVAAMLSWGLGLRVLF